MISRSLLENWYVRHLINFRTVFEDIFDNVTLCQGGLTTEVKNDSCVRVAVHLMQRSQPRRYVTGEEKFP